MAGSTGVRVVIGRAALADNPNNPQLMKTVSLALLQSGNPAEALGLLNRVVEATPNDARAHEYRSLALEQAGRIEEAESALADHLGDRLGVGSGVFFFARPPRPISSSSFRW